MFFKCLILTTLPFQVGEAIALNPGYLKLRKIRAAQAIAKTVSTFRSYFQAFFLLIRLLFEDGWCPEQSLITGWITHVEHC